MNRQQRRAMDRKQVKEKTRTYNFTEAEMKQHAKQVVSKEIDREYDRISNDAINMAVGLTFMIPLEILMKHYWPKSYKKKLPEFTKHMVEYFNRWENGELDLDQMAKDLWEFGGVRLQIEED